MNLLTELKQMQARIDAETDPVKRGELTMEFNEMMGEVQKMVRKLPSFRDFKNTLN